MYCDKPGNTEVVQLNLLTDTEIPISLPPYRVPERLSEKVEIAVQKLKDQGIIEHSTSPWSAPIVPIVKPSGDIRVCVDYRRLNNITAQEHYYMPELDDNLGKIGNSCVLSKMDLVQGFHQITVAETSRDKTTFVCPYGRFRYIRMPFGLKNAPALFQRAIEIVLEPCRTFATSYIDDLVIFSNNWGDHLEHLRAVFTELRRHNLTAKPKKCVFGKRYLEYLGHLIGSGRLAVPQHRIAALEAYIKPKMAKDMRSFLGTMSYYRKFINGYANYSALLSPPPRRHNGMCSGHRRWRMPSTSSKVSFLMSLYFVFLCIQIPSYYIRMLPAWELERFYQFSGKERRSLQLFLAGS